MTDLQFLSKKVNLVFQIYFAKIALFVPECCTILVAWALDLIGEKAGCKVQ